MHAIVSKRHSQHAASNDLLSDAIAWRTVTPKTNPITAFVNAVELLYDNNIDWFFAIDPQHVYRRDYIATSVSSIANTGLPLATTAVCVNLLNQEWAPRPAEGPGDITSYHFIGGLGLSPDEQSAGQEVGAPGTYVFNRLAAERLLELPGQQVEFADIPYDIVLRRYLFHMGINIRLLETDQPVFVHMSRHVRKVTRSQPSTDTQPSLPPVCHGGVSARPTVSIVVPTYNEGEWLYRTVESIRHAACNHSWEIIVVDDGCDDGSVGRVRHAPNVQVINTPASQSGIIVAKNLGAQAASGKYICFVDSHILVKDAWLDQLIASCESATRESMVTCNIFDVRQRDVEGAELGHQYGYTLSSWTLEVRWHHYGTNLFKLPYSVPLCPGGMMILRKARFEQLGGFAAALRKWGGEDIELSLRHYCAGGQILCDPNTHCFHYYKDTKVNRRKFSISYKQTAFNALYTARIYMDHNDYYNVRRALCSRARLDEVVADVQSAKYDQSVARVKAQFERPFDDWKAEFYRELALLSTNPTLKSAHAASKGP
jgi:glycosyltransferase involved in cell wall biosynthesis